MQEGHTGLKLECEVPCVLGDSEWPVARAGRVGCEGGQEEDETRLKGWMLKGLDCQPGFSLRENFPAIIGRLV